MAEVEEKGRENEEENEGIEKEKEGNFVGELNMMLVLLSLSESKDESVEKQESMRRSDNGEVTAKACISRLQPNTTIKTMLQPKHLRRPSPKSRTSTRDIRHGRRM
ncbi:uncharacterized protein LOC129287896 isoform X2 [Prosopis cineraria]|nr:uncharacterized protein LOC129287896 isoform X2 [Prosopis cineraria]